MFKEEFLNERTQKVVIINTILEHFPIFSGVLQGGVICPLLFIIYINDIASEVDVSSKINLFAYVPKMLSQSNITFKNSLDKIYNWLKEKKKKT